MKLKEDRKRLKLKGDIEVKFTDSRISLSFFSKLNNKMKNKLINCLNVKTKLMKAHRLFILNNGKIGILFDYDFLTIYETKNFKKLYEIKIRKKFCIIINVIELMNKDIIIYDNSGTIEIFKLKNKAYFSAQIIDDQENYSFQNDKIKRPSNPKKINPKMNPNMNPMMSPSPMMWNNPMMSPSPMMYNNPRMMCPGSMAMMNLKNFISKNIIKFGDNKFITISNFGFKIYSLKNDSDYSYVLINELYNNITNIYNINDDEIIIISTNEEINEYSEKNFTQETPNYTKLNDCLFNSDWNYNQYKANLKIYTWLIDKFNINKNILEKEIYKEETILQIDLINYVILKDKYFITIITTDLIVIDIYKCSIIQTIKLIYFRFDFLFEIRIEYLDWDLQCNGNYRPFNILGWKNNEKDNVFLLNNVNQFIIVELIIEKEENKESLEEEKKKMIGENITFRIIGNAEIPYYYGCNHRLYQIDDLKNQYTFYSFDGNIVFL